MAREGSWGAGHPGDSGQVPPRSASISAPLKAETQFLDFVEGEDKKKPRGLEGLFSYGEGGGGGGGGYWGALGVHTGQRDVMANRRLKPRAGELGSRGVSGGQQGVPRTP